MGLRNIVLLLIGVVGLAMLRSLVRELGRYMLRAAKPETAKQKPRREAGRLVRDPHTGTYIDPREALHATVGGTTFHFESEASRDAFLKSQG